MDTPRPLVPLPTTGLHQRAGDLDRSAVCDQLSVHYAAGRLREDELDARLTAAVSAETLLDLRRLVSDLPLAPAPPEPLPRPAPVQVLRAAPPRSVMPWAVLDVLALLTVIGCLGFAALMMLVLGGTPWVVAGGFGGGCVAALGGGALTHLVHRAHQRHAALAEAARAGADRDQRPRIA